MYKRHSGDNGYCFLGIHLDLMWQKGTLELSQKKKKKKKKKQKKHTHTYTHTPKKNNTQKMDKQTKINYLQKYEFLVNSNMAVIS